jgi:hypothetical protein
VPVHRTAPPAAAAATAAHSTDAAGAYANMNTLCSNLALMLIAAAAIGRLGGATCQCAVVKLDEQCDHVKKEAARVFATLARSGTSLSSYRHLTSFRAITVYILVTTDNNNNSEDADDDDAMPQAAPLKSLQAYYSRKAAAAADDDDTEGGDAPSGESLYAYANTNPSRRG